MMARGECLEWIVLYRSWSTEVRELLMLMIGRKTVRSEGVAREESGGSCDSGHYSIRKSRRRQDGGRLADC